MNLGNLVQREPGVSCNWSRRQSPDDEENMKKYIHKTKWEVATLTKILQILQVEKVEQFLEIFQFFAKIGQKQWETER